jgi:hypothetical protein
MEKYEALVVERDRSAQALMQSWARQQDQQVAQQRGAGVLTNTLIETAQQILEVQRGGLKRCIQEFQAEKERVHARTNDDKLNHLNQAILRCRSILMSVSPSFSQEILLQRRVFELQFMIGQLESNNAALAKLVDSQVCRVLVLASLFVFFFSKQLKDGFGASSLWL